MPAEGKPGATHLKQVVDTQANRVLSYRNDAYGQVLVREEKINNVLGARQLYYYFDGRRIGDVGNSGPSPSLIDYAQELALDRNAPRDKGGFRNGRPVESADFDQNFQPINASYPGPVAAMYTARNGDTLQSIARAAWGDANLWYLIADANGLTGNATLVAGQALSIPNKVTNFHNTSETFRVYNPGEAIGDAMPTLPAAPTMPAPPPPKKNGCGILGAILLAAVAVAVTLVIKVPVSKFFGTLFSAAGVSTATAATAGSIVGATATGAIASAVSQGVGIATGIQDKFSWKAVALAGISAGIGEGLGQVGFLKDASGIGKNIQDVARGALGNAVTQGIAVATKLQTRFDWSGVAVGAVVSGVNGATNFGGFGGRLVSGVLGAIAGGATRSLIDGSSFGDNVIAALPDVIGATIGQLVGEQITKGLAKGGQSVGQSSSNANKPNQAASSLGSPQSGIIVGPDGRLSLNIATATLDDQAAFFGYSSRAFEARAAAKRNYFGYDTSSDAPQAGVGSQPGEMADVVVTASPKAIAAARSGYQGVGTVGYVRATPDATWVSSLHDLNVHGADGAATFRQTFLPSNNLGGGIDYARKGILRQDLDSLERSRLELMAMRENATGADKSAFDKLLAAIEPAFKEREAAFQADYAKQGRDALKVTATYGAVSAALLATGGVGAAVLGGEAIGALGWAGLGIALDYGQAGARGWWDGSYDAKSTVGGIVLNAVPGVNGYGEQAYGIASLAVGGYALLREVPGAIGALRGPASERAFSTTIAADSTVLRSIDNPFEPGLNPVPQAKFDLWYNYLSKRGVKFEIGTDLANAKLAENNAAGLFERRIVDWDLNTTERTIYLPENPNASTFYEEGLHALDSLRARPGTMELGGRSIDAYEYRAKSIMLNSPSRLSYPEAVMLEHHLDLVKAGRY
ncbi:MAG: LysM domain-containing protein [Candidatus Sphingomonas phytovorans]|nr:LysM domain-containing protein [Sphingomonas sp.]WEJ99467.1 MAG: LysM domain-containing protein [Sphingomonas sp.]